MGQRGKGEAIEGASFFLINIQMEFCSLEGVCAVMEKSGGFHKKDVKVGGSIPRAISLDLSIPPFRASVGLNCSIKALSHQIQIDFPKPSASAWEDFKVMFYQNGRQTQKLEDTKHIFLEELLAFCLQKEKREVILVCIT